MSTTATSPEIHFPDGFDKRWEGEMTVKGYLSDVIVQFEGGLRFRVNFIDPVRLTQDLAREAKSGTPYFAEPAMIVIPEVTTDGIRKAVEGLMNEGFFEALKPIPDDAAGH